MAIRISQKRSVAPLIVGGALALLALFPARARCGAGIERVRVDPARDPGFLLESLEGMGSEGARRIVTARKALVTIDSPEDLIAIPGVGPRLLHRWHPDLAFAKEVR